MIFILSICVKSSHLFAVETQTYDTSFYIQTKYGNRVIQRWNLLSVKTFSTFVVTMNRDKLTTVKRGYFDPFRTYFRHSGENKKLYLAHFGC